MAGQRVITNLAVALAFACAANTGFAQTQATTTNGTQTSGTEGQSAAALAQQASNPFASKGAAPSGPISTNQATALHTRVYPLGRDQPEGAISLR